MTKRMKRTQSKPVKPVVAAAKKPKATPAGKGLRPSTTLDSQGSRP